MLVRGQEIGGRDKHTSIRWDSHQLRGFVGVTHVLDDSGEKEGDGVKWSVDSDGDKHMHIDLPVSECIPSIFQVEFIGEGPTIGLETTLNLCTLLLSQERSAKFC